MVNDCAELSNDGWLVHAFSDKELLIRESKTIAAVGWREWGYCAARINRPTAYVRVSRTAAAAVLCRGLGRRGGEMRWWTRYVHGEINDESQDHRSHHGTEHGQQSIPNFSNFLRVYSFDFQQLRHVPWLCNYFVNYLFFFFVLTTSGHVRASRTLYMFRDSINRYYSDIFTISHNPYTVLTNVIIVVENAITKILFLRQRH